MNRRAFLGAGVALSAFGGRIGAAEGEPAPVTSDVGPLRRVLVHAPGAETDRLDPAGEAAVGGVAVPPLDPEGIAQHRALVDRLVGGGAEVLRVVEVLDGAVERAREAGQLHEWVGATLPQLAGREAEIDGEVLIGARPLADEPPADEQTPALVHPQKSLLFARDLGVATPRGVVLGHFLNRFRAFETTLLRFALRWSPALRGAELAFDAGAEGVLLQGGDLIVLDERTLVLGVGNLTEPAAAPRLAQRLGLDVLAVQLPGGGDLGGDDSLFDWNGLRTLLLHLDSAFNLVDRRLAVAAPYLFERRFAEPRAARRLAAALARALGDDSWNPNVLRAVGRVQLYRAGTGRTDRSVEGQKLVDYLKGRGFAVAFAGGPPPARVDADHLIGTVVPELLGQAANVVAIAPGRVVAFAENAATLGALRAAGADVVTTPGTLIAPWHGGPHCLTLPLRRAPLA